MKIGILKEQADKRVAITPELAGMLIGEGNTVIAEKGCGAEAYYDDPLYAEKGVKMSDRQSVLKSSELLTTIHPLTREDLQLLPKGAVYISMLQPFASLDKTREINNLGLTAFSMDMIPRITRAQSMDVLSSMASIAGYKAIIRAADLLPRYFPMLTTAAGSIPPAKVLVIGAGVAGLQAIATAKRLGAVVEAFDTRTAAREEVESLGARFVEVEGAKDDAAAGGYAVEQTEEYQQKQRQLILDHASRSDVIITTAQLRGKPAPVLITEQAVKNIKPGSVIIDLASSSGGNCELTQDQKTIVAHEVTIIGNSNFAADISTHASQLYGKNFHNFIKLFLKEGKIELDWDDPIIKSSCVAHNGEIYYGK